jgi:hypothetical protein
LLQITDAIWCICDYSPTFKKRQKSLIQLQVLEHHTIIQ